MPDELYRPPTCPIYVDRLIADTMDLTDEEFGVYMRLMLGRQWSKGSIPADAADQARLTHNQTPAKMRKFAAVIGERFQPHPTVPNAVHSPFMERVRAGMEQRNRKSSESGKKGAKKRWQRDSGATSNTSQNDGNPNGDPMANASQIDEFQFPDPISTPSATPRDSAHAGEDGVAISRQADALSDYLLEVAIEHCTGRGIQMAHWTGELHAKWLVDNRAESVVLVQSYGLEACKVRALAYVVAVRDGKITSRIITVGALRKAWNYRELTEVVKAAAEAGPSFDEMMGQAS